MKVLVVGASGQTGRWIVQRLARQDDVQVVGTYTSRPREGLVYLDLRNPASIHKLVRDIAPQLVLQPGCLTNVDYCQEHPDEAMQINAEGSAALAEVSRALGARFVHYSTDYVFDGMAGPYVEDDEPRPISHYGKSKREAETRVLSIGGHVLLIRTANIFSYLDGDKNFFMQMFNAFQDKRPMTLYTDQAGTPTYAPALVEATLKLIDIEFEGLIHVAGPDFVSRAQWGDSVARALQWDPTLIQKVRVAERPQKAPRPSKAGLRCERARSAGIEIPGIAEALRDICGRIPTSDRRSQRLESLSDDGPRPSV